MDFRLRQKAVPPKWPSSTTLPSSDRAIEDRRLLASDVDATFDREVVLNAREIAPVPVLKLPLPDDETIQSVTAEVFSWAKLVRDSSARWSSIGSNEDRKPIINSSGFGLIDASGEEFEEIELD